MGTPHRLSDLERASQYLDAAEMADADGCWHWRGGWSGEYPTFNARIAPSRYSPCRPQVVFYEAKHGPTGKGLHLARVCESLDCVNPAHFRVEPFLRYGDCIAERFWSRVEKSDGCWLWRGVVNNAGYGRFFASGSYWLAHRYSYYLEHGRVPRQLVVCHHCDTPLCVNPAHLFIGTQKDNIQDMIAKGRKRPASRPKKTLAQIAA